MTLKEIFKEVFYLLKEDRKKCNEAELIGYANDCREDLVKRLPLADIINLQNHLVIGKFADEDTLLPGAGLYALPTNFLRDDSVIGYTTKRNADKIELGDFWSYQAGYAELSSAKPVYCIIHYANLKKIIFAPKEAKILLIYYKQPPILTAVTESPQMDSGVHHLFIPYICYKVLMALDKVDKAVAFKTEYNEGIKSRGGV